ncbi:MAG TPA: metallopeptidase TldD-related protein, partial [Syntrophorhabdaceae bacterium]
EEGIEKAFPEYELFFLRERIKKFETRETELSGAEVKEETGIALRAIKDGKMVFSYTFDAGSRAVASLVENAELVLPFLEVDKDKVFPEGASTYPELDIWDEEGLRADDRQKTSLLADMEQTILDYDSRIKATRSCELQETRIEATILNSRGLRADARKTLYTLSAMCVAREADEASWFSWIWADKLSGLDGKGLGEETARTAVSLLSSTQLDTGVYDGVLTPQAACDLLEILAESFLAENLHKGKTRLAGKTGQKCFSPLLSITDSGLAGIDSFPFDGEGVASRANQVVKGGVFETFLYDAYYGRKLGNASTGNAVRPGIKGPPSCGPRGLFIEKGELDLTSDGLDGILIVELMGAHTANPITGDFSLGATGFLKKKGTISPFTGVIFSGNLFEILEDIKGVGRDLRFYGSHGSPSLYVEGLKISGR